MKKSKTNQTNQSPPVNTVINSICNNCNSKKYSIGYVRELLCMSNCWIINSINSIDTKKISNKPKQR